jgi:hypothetical protein
VFVLLLRLASKRSLAARDAQDATAATEDAPTV